MWLIPIFFLIAFEAIADIFGKEYAIHKNLSSGCLSLLFYCICNTFWIIALRCGSKLSTGAIIFSVASAVLAISIGHYMYDEPISCRNYIGFIFGVIAILLLL